MNIRTLKRKNAQTWILYIALMLMGYVEAVQAQSGDATLAPKVIQNPADYFRYAEQSRRFTGISSIAVTEKGRLWATWYAGVTPGEDENNYVVLATSDDQGKTWEEVLAIDPDGKGPVRAYDPEVWIDPDNQLWLFWAQSTKNYTSSVYGVWALTTLDIDQKDGQWSAPKRLSDGVMMCKPTVLSSGEWLLPVSTWRYTDNSAKVIVSEDHGKSWKLRGGVDVPKEDREFDEHMVVERKDGSLWMLVRTKYGIGESTSTDRGKTWGPLKHSGILHTSSRFFIRRLSSGNLLLVKHGPIQIKTARSHLMAFVSTDDGHSWSKGLLLDERLGVSYPDGQQTADGRIFITYDFGRTKDQHINLITFSEDDITASETDERLYHVFLNRKLISDGGTPGSY